MKDDMNKIDLLILCLVVLLFSSVSSGEMNLRNLANKEINTAVNRRGETQQNPLYRTIYALRKVTGTEANTESINTTSWTSDLSDEEMKRLMMTKGYQKAKRALGYATNLVAFFMYLFIVLFFISLPCFAAFVFWDAIKRGKSFGDAFLWGFGTLIFIFYWLPKWFWVRPNFYTDGKDLCPSCEEIYMGKPIDCPHCGFNLIEKEIVKITEEEHEEEEKDKLKPPEIDEDDENEDDEIWKATL